MTALFLKFTMHYINGKNKKLVNAKKRDLTT